MAQFVIDHAAIEVHLARIFGFEVAALEIDHHIAALFEMVEEQVDIEILLTNVEVVLPPDKQGNRMKFRSRAISSGSHCPILLVFCWL